MIAVDVSVFQSLQILNSPGPRLKGRTRLPQYLVHVEYLDVIELGYCLMLNAFVIYFYIYKKNKKCCLFFRGALYIYVEIVKIVLLYLNYSYTYKDIITTKKNYILSYVASVFIYH